MLNGVTDSGSGPLAFLHMWTGSGLRGALRGHPSEQVRLGLAIGFSVLAVLARLRVGAAVRRLVRAAQRAVGPGPTPSIGNPTTRFGAVLGRPWYPWLVVTIPILHFLANNQLHFSALEAIGALGVALAGMTLSVVGLRLALKDWHRASAAATILAVVFFAYGHVEHALGSRVDQRALFAVTVVLAVAALVGMSRSGGLAARWTELFNGVAAILLVFPVVSLASGTLQSVGRTPPDDAVTIDDLQDHLPPLNLSSVSGPRPNIYYIILDEYSRHDALAGFDNTDFLRELERRGFYVASEATSNYMSSIPSIAATMNMEYIHNLVPSDQAAEEDLLRRGRYNALTAILKTLGYTYVHLESGYKATNQAPLADIFVTFTPSGALVCRGDNRQDAACDVSGRPSGTTLLAGRFLRELAQTTILRPAVGYLFELGDTEPYEWWTPQRALLMFDFLTDPIEVDGPKFVMARIVKPHSPATFDRHGNYTSSALPSDAFDDSHDPSVPNAFIGQLIYINLLTLEMIDGILESDTGQPIIVLAADHARREPGLSPHPILAAFLLPNGEEALYSSISSVNHFRAILDHQFGLGLGLLEDRTFDADLNEVAVSRHATPSRRP